MGVGLVSTGELAAKLAAEGHNIDVAWLRDLIRRGKIAEPTRINGQRVWDTKAQAAVAAYVTKNPRQPRPVARTAR